MLKIHYLVELKKDCLVRDPVIQAIANDLADLLTYYQDSDCWWTKRTGCQNHDGSTGSKSGQVQIIVVT